MHKTCKTLVETMDGWPVKLEEGTQARSPPDNRLLLRSAGIQMVPKLPPAEGAQNDKKDEDDVVEAQKVADARNAAMMAARAATTAMMDAYKEDEAAECAFLAARNVWLAAIAAAKAAEKAQADASAQVAQAQAAVEKAQAELTAQKAQEMLAAAKASAKTALRDEAYRSFTTALDRATKATDATKKAMSESAKAEQAVEMYRAAAEDMAMVDEAMAADAAWAARFRSHIVDEETVLVAKPSSVRRLINRKRKRGAN